MSANHAYPPLVTARSPSLARAQAEHASSPAVAETVALLAQLSEAEDNARKAFSTVAELMTFEAAADLAREAASSHESRRQALGRLIDALGGAPPEPGECRDILMRGIDAVARASTETEGLAAIEVLREELATAYEQALESPVLGDAQRALVARLARPSGSA